MRKTLFIFITALFLFACRRSIPCENATVYKSNTCGVEWEIEFEGKRYPAMDLPDALKRDKNRIYLLAYHFYDDPRTCACCGYHYLVVETALDELTCI